LNVADNQVVSIETVGALIYGAWGSDGESVGVLKGMTKRPNHPLEARTVDTSCHGSILVAGMSLGREPLIRAQDVEVRGIITGSLAPELLPVAEHLHFPIIVTDGLGNLPMTEDIFDLLKENEGREASLSGRTEMPWDAQRPEIIIPMPNSKPTAGEKRGQRELTRGARVRIVRAPYLGSVGTVIDIPRHALHIATGARAHCARVDIGQDETVLVPLVNLEILR
jgi:hypothetical protein